MNPYQYLLYRRGFVFSESPVSPPHETWPLKQVSSFWFSYDPITPCHLIQQDDGWCLLFGVVNDLFNPEMGGHKLTQSLLTQFIRSDDAFCEMLDGLTGRFLLVVSNCHTTRVYQDACGMRSVFYSTEERILSSHLELLVDQMQHPAIPQFHLLNLLEKYTSYHLPGNITPYHHVYWLTPNTCLDLKTLSVRRFFPREPLVEGDPDRIYDEVIALATRQAEFFVRHYRTLVSLSGGRDSRLTLAFLRDVRDEVQFYTYFKSCDLGMDEMNSQVLLRDKQLAGDIARNLRLNHQFVELDYAQQTSAAYGHFVAVMARNTYQHHNYYLAWKYLHCIPPESLHINSLHQGNTRLVFKNRTWMFDQMNLEAMAVRYHRDAAEDPDVKAYFRRYAAVTQFDQILNWNPFDLFHWEYRKGIWAPTVLLEADAAFDTICLFGNRYLLNKLFQLPESHLIEDRDFWEIFRRRWPILMFWPVNNEPAPLYTFPVGGLSLEGCSVEGRSIEGARLNTYRKSEEDGILFYLNRNPPKKGDQVVFSKPLEIEPGQGYYLACEITSPCTRLSLKRNMHYTVTLGSQLVCREDVAAWGGTNLIQILFEAQGAIMPLTVAVTAQQDCGPLRSGSVARVFIQHITLRPMPYHGIVRARCSSPFSTLAVPDFNREDLI